MLCQISRVAHHVQVRVIEQVERFSPELQSYPFRKLCVFVDPKIEGPESGCPECVATRHSVGNGAMSEQLQAGFSGWSIWLGEKLM